MHILNLIKIPIHLVGFPPPNSRKSKTLNLYLHNSAFKKEIYGL